jgi:hypothetical protein
VFITETKDLWYLFKPTLCRLNRLSRAARLRLRFIRFERKDELEIGPLFRGQTKAVQKSYVEGISAVLNNCKKYLKDDYNVFLVANDKYNLYPQIAEKSGMKIVNQFRRPVLNRTEKDKGAYSEIIFHLKNQ